MKNSGINRGVNKYRYEVLNLIKRLGTATRLEVVEATGINVGTISQLFRLLESEGLIVNVGKSRSFGGRPSEIYKVNPRYGYSIGVDVGGANIRVVVADLAGEIIYSAQTNSLAKVSSKEEILVRLTDLVRESISGCGIDRTRFVGIGFGISGLIDKKSGVCLFCPNIPSLRNEPIRAYFEEVLGLPVVVDDSLRMMAVSEKRFGKAKQHDDFMVVSIGVGVGSAIFANGRIYRGAYGVSGEIGHITVNEQGPRCNCGNLGCLEAIASGPGIVKRTRESIEDGVHTSLVEMCGNDLDRLTPEMIARAASEGDKLAYYIVNRTGEYIGMAIASALNMFGSELVILAGGVAKSGDILVDAIRRTVKLRALQDVSNRVKIEVSELGEMSSALGAAAMAADEFFFKEEL